MRQRWRTQPRPRLGLRSLVSSNSPGSARLRARYEALKSSVDDMIATINTERQWRVASETRVKILESSGVEMAADLAAEREARSAAGDEVQGESVDKNLRTGFK